MKKYKSPLRRSDGISKALVSFNGMACSMMETAISTDASVVAIPKEIGRVSISSGNIVRGNKGRHENLRIKPLASDDAGPRGVGRNSIRQQSISRFGDPHTRLSIRLRIDTKNMDSPEGYFRGFIGAHAVVVMPTSRQVPVSSAIFSLKAKRELKLNYFQEIQNWEGFVVGVNVRKKTFVAHLKNKIGEKSIAEAEFTMEEVSKNDQSLIEIGSSFYWSMGFREDESGGKERVSSIRFQRVTLWTSEDIDRAKNMAKILQKELEE